MKLYFDENMPPHLARGFGILQNPESLKSGRPVEVRNITDDFSRGTQDVDWLAGLDAQDCVITQDLQIHRRKQEMALYREKGIGMFFLRGPSKKQGMTVWDMVQLLAKHWGRIIEIMHTGERPFAYEISSRGIKRIG